MFLVLMRVSKCALLFHLLLFLGHRGKISRVYCHVGDMQKDLGTVVAKCLHCLLIWYGCWLIVYFVVAAEEITQHVILEFSHILLLSFSSRCNLHFTEESLQGF